MLRSNTSNSPTITPYQHARIATAAHIRNRFIQYAVIGTLTLATSFAVAAASPFAGQANPTHNPSAETPYQIRVFTGKNPNTSEMIQVTDIDGNGLIDSGDASLLLLNLSDDSTDVPSNNQSDIPNTDNSQSSTPAFAAATTSGMQGLHAKNYLVTDGATTYSVMDVYVRFGSAVGTGSAGERIVSVFGQTTTDTSSGNVSKLAKYLNDKALAFQHSNISWLPAAGSNGGTGNTTWDSFVTIGCRNQGLTNSAGVLNDPFFANPNGPSVAALVNGVNGSGLFPGAGWAQNNPLDAGFETNAGANADKLVMIGRFTLKVSDILALGAGVTPKLTVFCNTTGKSTAQSGGTTLYTIAAANLKSDATTTYTTSGQTWTFTSTFEGAGGQTPWTFATINEAAVSDLVATDATLSDGIQLTWTPLVGAPGYSVWRSENGVTYAQIATIATNTGLYDDLKANSNGPSDNTLYYYKVRSTSPTATLFSNVDTGSTSISAPNNVLASDGTFTDKVQITWDAVSVATAYDIFRNASATKLGTVDGFTTTYNDITAVPGAAYSYTVKALSGTVSSGTTAASIGYRALATPTAPTASTGDYIGTGGVEGVEVVWSTVIGATGYDVYRDSEATKIGSPAGTTLKFIDSTASITESHTYRIKATATTASTGTVVTSPFSGNSNAGWIGIGMTAEVRATRTFADKVVVTWDPVPGATAYQINRASVFTTNGNIVNTVPASALSYNDITVPTGTGYTYFVAAVNAVGVGQYRSSVPSAGLRVFTPPTNVLASLGTFEDKIEVTWTPVSGAVSYDIYRNDLAARIGTVVTTVSTVTTWNFNDFSALPGTDYTYSVRATNPGVPGLFSALSAPVPGLRGAATPTPTITSVNPNTGVLAGATTITITGTNLANASSVTVGGVTATGLVLISPTQVSAVTPASATAGAKTVVVTTPGGTATAVGAFTYTDATLPSIALISPLSGPTSGGTPLTITGTNLIGATVTIGGNPVTSPTVTATQITALIPAGTAGVQDVVVTVAGVVVGGSATSNAFTYVAQPTISSITPNTGLTTGSTSVTITGTNLLGASVTVNDTQATLLGNSATQVTILTPVSAVGSVALVVTTAGGSASATYIYAAVPTIASTGITPNVGATTGGTTVTIDGTNFANATGVTIGGVAATGFVYVSATRVIAISPAGTLGAKDVAVVIPSGSATSTGGFTYTNAALPTLTFVSPSSGSILGATVVTLTGTNFTGATSVTVGGVAATSFQVMSATSIVVVTPTGSIGDKDIVVVTPSGSATKTAAFEYVDLSLPTISTVSPTFGPTAGGTEIVIIGTNLTGATSVTIGGVAASSFAVGSATSMTAVTGVSATAGVKDVVVTTPVGVATKSGSFSYQEPVIPAPTIFAVSPVSGSVGGGTTITITGTNLTGATAVTVDGVEATSLIVASSTSMSAVTPAGTAGSKSVAVTTPGGTATKQIAFTYNTTLPTILTVSPSSGPLVGDTLITVTGTNLANVISLTINGYETTSLVATATSITARTPVGTAGAKTMFLTTSVGTTLSYTNGYTYVSAPTISTVSPTFGPTAGGTEITITGTNLSTVTGVTVDGVAATSVLATTSSITALTPARSTGVKDIVVTTTGGAVTKVAAYTFTDSIPTITSVTPNQGPAAGNTEVVIVGTNLADTTSVKFGTADGNVVDSTSTQISVLTPVGSAGVKDVVVTNSNGTATKTAAFTFYSSSALPTISSVSPTSGIVLGGTSVTITGTLMANTTGVKVGGVAASFVVNSSTSVTIVTPVAVAAGATTIVVTTSNGSSVGKAFTYTDFTISPSVGPSSGGTPITITGTQLTGATSVTFGGIPATGLVVVSPTKIVALTPSNSEVTHDVAVTIPTGTMTKVAAFQYTDFPPTVTTVTPNVGVKAGGTNIVINGTNFQTLGTTTVTVGGTAATNVVVNSSTQISAKTPIGTVGAQPVTVSSYKGSGTLNGAFTFYGIPTIASTGTPVSPVSGPTSGGTVITITGTNLIGATNVTVGGANATLVSVTDTVLTAITPTGTVGAQTIVVTAPGGVATKTAAFTFVAAPTITSVTPTSGSTTGGTQITIAGTNFTGATSVTVGGVAVSFFSVASATSMTANTNISGAGLKDIVVTTPGGSVTKSGAFTFVVPAPAIDSVAPSSGPINGGTSIVINGTGFSGVTSVLVGGSVANIIAVKALQITAVTPAGTTAGVAKDVVVNTPAGSVRKVGAFTYVALQAPTIASVSPNTGPAAGGTSFTIVGTNLTGASSVTIGGVAATGLTVVNSTTLTATTPSGSGAQNVVVTTAGGSATATAAFTYTGSTAATIASVSPSSGPAAGGTTITIVGTNLTGAAVTVGGSIATVLTNSATVITATTPAGTAGAAKDVVVVATGGTVTASGVFTYAYAPTINIISPSSGPVAGGTTITITGTNLASATVTVGGASATVLTNSATVITATTPPGTAGAQNVAVTTAGGAFTFTDSFTYVAAPIISSVSPSSGPLAAGTAITITGTNFTGATVTVGGSAATSVVVNGSGTSLTAATPAGTVGAKDVVVTTVGGAATSTGAFTYVAAPTITSVSPTSGTTLGGTAFTITGTNLTGASSVTVGGVAATSVVVVNSTTITAITPIGNAGAQIVTATTIGGTGNKPNAFTYVIPAPTGLVATDGTSTTQITVTWNAVPGVTGYDIFRDNGATKIGSTLAQPPETKFDDTTAVAGIIYTYTVKATSATGISAASVGDTGWRNVAAPTGITASDALFTNKIQISWNAVTSATGYDIYRNEATTKIGSSVGTATTYWDSAITIGTIYTYTVKATTAAGSSDASTSDTGFACADSDLDGITDCLDNCPAIANPTQTDCDHNGIGDVCDIASGAAKDCNNNGTPDSCDITAGALDLNQDGTLDLCQGLSENDITSGSLGVPTANVAGNYTFTGLARAMTDVTMTIRAKGDFDGGVVGTEFLTLKINDVTLQRLFETGGVNCSSTTNGGVSTAIITIPLATFAQYAANRSMKVTLLPSPSVTAGECANGFMTVQLKYVGISASGDCDNNAQWDAGEISANRNLDRNNNGHLDFCEFRDDPTLDRNNNGLFDSAEIAADPTLDRNQNGVLDSWEISQNTALDRNGNGILDSWEISQNTALDCNGNLALDQYEILDDATLDCNLNGVLDSCEIAGFKNVLAWGDNDGGQCDIPASANSGVTAIAGGGYHTIALKGGAVLAWGNNDYGQCTIPASANSGVSAIAGGYRHTIALKDGAVLAWGWNEYGQCNIPASANSGVSAIAGGVYHTIALKDGAVLAWGRNGYGACTIPASANSGVSAIAGGVYHTIALKDGAVLAWGYNGQGQCTIPASAKSGVSAIAGGGYHTIALKDGAVLAWGDNYVGQCTIPASAKSGVSAIAGGYFHTIALKGGAVLAWGNNYTIPASAKSGVSAIAGGGYHTIALRMPVDTNTNGRFDSCEIAANPALDRDGNGVLDSYDCLKNPDLDCNSNLLIDQYEIIDNPGIDCNGNNVIDTCPVDAGAVDDDSDGIPDSCERAKGDLDLSGFVDTGDFSILLLYYGEIDPVFGDFDGNGMIDSGDASLMLLYFGEVTWP